MQHAQRRTEATALLAVCGLAAVLRFATLSVQSFDFDESFTVGIVVNGSLGHVLHTIPLTESSPPLYYVLAWLWSQTFGLGEFGIRSLSALAGTALVPVTYMIARRLGSPRAGLVAALLVAVNPLLVWYSQEARTYALLALLSALSFWTFLRALDQPDRRRLAAWTLASAAALLSHYFAGFLVAAEALWLVLGTRRQGAVLASIGVGLVGAALLPLLIRQSDHRTEWIGSLTLASRIKEVIKKLVTGEIDPTHNWQLALLALVAGGAMVYAARRLSPTERRGAALTLIVGGAAIVVPLILDFAGLHYLISKNVMPAVPVLLIGAALLFGAERAGRVGLIGAGLACAFFLGLVVDAAVDPSLQRFDYRAAARALGPPAAQQVVVTAPLGDVPVSVYRPGAAPVPAAGWITRRVVVVAPLPRADAPQRRAVTPPAPAGFTFEGRIDARTYTLICFSSPVPRQPARAALLALIGGSGADAQVWPQAQGSAGGRAACARAR